MTRCFRQPFLRPIFTAVFLHFLWSNSAAAQTVPAIPFDANWINKGVLAVPLRFEPLDKPLLFIIDTGSPITLIDKSFNRLLGKRKGRLNYQAWDLKAKGATYEAPKFFAGETQLLTGSNILTCNLKQFSPDFVYPLVGVLGMDSLQHYCLQVDFSARQIRFLDSLTDQSKMPGKQFPIVFSTISQTLPGYFRTFIEHSGLIGGTEANLLIDTGFDLDGAIDPDLLKSPLLFLSGRSPQKMDNGRWYIPETIWDGAAYTNLVVRETLENAAGKGGSVLGLRFLSRFLVTFDFPNRLLYLHPQAAGPRLIDEDHSLESLLPINGILPFDIEKRLNILIQNQRPPWYFRWFGGTIEVRVHGDPTILKYSMRKKGSDGHWHIQKAWRVDSNGKILQTYLVPSK